MLKVHDIIHCLRHCREVSSQLGSLCRFVIVSLNAWSSCIIVTLFVPEKKYIELWCPLHLQKTVTWPTKFE